MPVRTTVVSAPIQNAFSGVPNVSGSSVMNTTAPAHKPRTSKLWLGISVVLALVLLVGAATMASMYEQLKAQIVHLQERLAVTPQVRYVSVLLDAQELPALLVTLDPQAGVLQVQRQVRFFVAQARLCAPASQLMRSIFL